MTELAIPTASNMPAVPDYLIEAYPALDPAVDIADMLEETLGPGGEIRLGDLTRIKVPSADFDRLMVPDDTGRTSPVDKLIGIPVAMTSRRSFWPTPEPSGKPPSCSSRDLVHGQGEFGPGSAENPTGLCEKCPMSQIGSMKLIAPGREGNASACKEQKLIFLISDVELLPMVLVVPPGSLQNHKAFGMWLFKQRVRGPLRGVDETTGKQIRGSAWLGVEVEIALEQDQNAAGQRYNKLKFGVHKRLEPDAMPAIDAMGRWVDELINKQADALDRMAEEAADPSGAPRAEDAEESYDDDGAPLDDLEDEVQVTGRGAKR